MTAVRFSSVQFGVVWYGVVRWFPGSLWAYMGLDGTTDSSCSCSVAYISQIAAGARRVMGRH